MSRSLDRRLARLEAVTEAQALRAEIAAALATGHYHPSLTVETVLTEMHRLAALPLAEWRDYYADIYAGLSPAEVAEADGVQGIFRRRLHALHPRFRTG
jgi:hypothetical protein